MEKELPNDPAQPHKDNGDERLPLVDEEGRVVGTATRRWCHGGSMALHPVVHLHVTDPHGRLYLQQRPRWKDIQPGRWDTAVGGHVDAGESIAQALEREAREELGLTADVVAHARFVARYVYPSERERELVHTYLVQVDHTVDLRPNPDEVDDARFWTAAELAEAARHDLLTPNLAQELRLYLNAEIH